jgi:cell division septation protein DedD
MISKGLFKVSLSLCVAVALAGCEEGGLFPLSGKSGDTPTASTATRLVERDVEAPDVFQANENGLWDGRPSLGGIWVAYPGVTDPERVIIRNETNGKFVIGALFRRERENPGPKLMISSDAASALGMLAGQPTLLNVTALRKEEVPLNPPAPEPTATLDAPEPIEAEPLAPLAAAAAALDEAEAGAPAADIAPEPPVAAAAPKPSALEKPFIQIGIFGVEENATGTGNLLRDSGIVPTVLKQESRGKTFWRVLIGPVGTSAERAALLKNVKELGFTDAYFVTN